MALQILRHGQQKRRVPVVFFTTISERSGLSNFICLLLGLLFAPLTYALPSEPSPVTIFQISCAHQCDADTIRQGLIDLNRKEAMVGESSLNIQPRSCPADRSGTEELTSYEKLVARWPGLRMMALPDNAAAKLHVYACGAKDYFLIEFREARSTLYLITPEGLLLSLAIPTASAMPPPSPSPRSGLDSAIGGEAEKKFNTVKIFFGTNRARTTSKKLAEQYGTERGELEVGQIEVTVPFSHKEGDIEQPKWLRFEFSKDPEKHMVLANIVSWSLASFRRNLQNAIFNDPDASAFLFIHGFNVSFEDASLRTAQMAWDLKLLTAPLMFSWPSKSNLEGYAADEDNVVWAVRDLRVFLDEIVNQTGARKVHVIAHSMGNRALVQALQQFARLDDKPRFNQVILAAPDIDASVFKRDIAPVIKQSAEQLTIYASSKDKALKASKKVHNNQRVGDATGIPLVIAGIDTVDASAVDTDFLGHSYFGDEISLLKDIGIVFKTGATAEQRKLKKETRGNTLFWSVQ
jgi:esterase/lipase superfamily enzyme